MPILVDPDQDAIDTVMRAFLVNVLPTGTEVIIGQDNRVAEPNGQDFVVMTWLRRERIETNIDDSEDVFYVGSIAGGTLTVSSVHYGVISLGANVWGTGVALGTAITGMLSGTGGVGTYKVNPPQSVPGQPLASGFKSATQLAEHTYQLDVHGPNSADNAQIITTLWRDLYAFDFVQALNTELAPLHADDPRQIPFINAENQFENRWIVEALLQANQTVRVPQQYADVITVIPKSVDVEFPE